MKEEQEPINLAAISRRHIHGIDKLYRMHAGLSSELVSYESEVIELEIRHGARWKKSPEVTARQMADCWRNHNPELSAAVAFLVHIYEKPTPPGFCVPAKQLKSKQALQALVDQVKAMTTNPEPDILLATIRGRFEGPVPEEE